MKNNNEVYEGLTGAIYSGRYWWGKSLGDTKLCLIERILTAILWGSIIRILIVLAIQVLLIMPQWGHGRFHSEDRSCALLKEQMG